MSENSLKAIGISSVVIGVLILAGMAGLAYKNFYDLELTKLRILQAQKDLGLPMDNSLVKKYVDGFIPETLKERKA